MKPMCSAPRSPGSRHADSSSPMICQWIQCSAGHCGSSSVPRIVVEIGSNPAYRVNGTATPRAEEDAPMPKHRRLETGRPGSSCRRRRGLEGRRPRAAGRHARRSSTSSGRSRRPCSNWPAKASCTDRRTRASGRRAARSARSSACARRDAVNGSHRGHHQFLAKALTHVTAASDPTSPRSSRPTMQEVLQRTLAEILGLAQGYCRGRGGSMHLQWFEAGALGTNAIVGGGAPMATGNAWAQKHSGTDRPHDQLLRRRREPDRLGAGDR